MFEEKTGICVVAWDLGVKVRVVVELVYHSMEAGDDAFGVSVNVDMGEWE